MCGPDPCHPAATRATRDAREVRWDQADGIPNLGTSGPPVSGSQPVPMPTAFTHPMLYKILELLRHGCSFLPVPLLITEPASRNYIVSRGSTAVLMCNEMLSGTPKPHRLRKGYIES